MEIGQSKGKPQSVEIGIRQSGGKPQSGERHERRVAGAGLFSDAEVSLFLH
jgi:hypothetical protein